MVDAAGAIYVIGGRIGYSDVWASPDRGANRARELVMGTREYLRLVRCTKALLKGTLGVL